MAHMAASTSGLSVVTGAFSFTGKYIASRLLDDGQRVKTLTGHPDRSNPFGERMSVAPLDFDDRVALTRSLEGADTLYNTYWVRFERGPVTFERAVQNTNALVEAAVDAGVQKIVHISHLHASTPSSLPYFRGKGLAEEAVSHSGLSYAMVRPSLIFGREDILVNNIAWALRRFPVFPIAGSGHYQMQPVFVEDVAEIAVTASREEGNQEIDAIGPETYTFENFVRLIADTAGRRARLMHLPPGLAFVLTGLVGYLVQDVVLTRQEVEGLMADLLFSQAPPTGQTRFSEWLSENASGLGKSYTSELGRHYR